MNKKLRTLLILVILVILVSSVTFIVTADNWPCSMSWPTNTKSPELTSRPVGGTLDAYSITDGFVNVCTGVIPSDQGKANNATWFTLEEACLYFHNEHPCSDNPDTIFELDNTDVPWEVVIVNPEDPDTEYTTGTWNISVDADRNFTFTKIYNIE